MAHVQQLFDHINQQFRRIYKDGVWVKAYVTKIGKNKKGNVFFECIDAKKYDQDKPTASVVFRLMDPYMQSYLFMISKLGINKGLDNISTFERGELGVAFKIMPAMHFERGMMPIIRDISANNVDVQRENLKSGIRIGVENSQLNKPINTGKPWTVEDNENLTRLIGSDDLSIESISLVLKRTAIGCVEQAESLGILKNEKRTLMRRDAVKLSRLVESGN